jgi:CBS domain-containing protein
MDMGISVATEPVERADPREPLSVAPDFAVRDVLKLLKATDRGEVLVCRDGVLVGIFTERDALRVLARHADLDCPIERVMTPDPVTLGEGDALKTAIVKMGASGYRRLPIVDDRGRPTSLLSVAGIVHWIVEHFPQAVYNLPPVSKPVMYEREGP